jgi:CxxC motif-containing protein (DUF1111 family)
MKINFARTMIAVAAFMVVASSTAQLGVGGAPTGHRHKLHPVPPHRHPDPNGNVAQFGDPLVGLTAAQLAAFTAGREEFESIETADGGLGPIYNNDSCAACHSAPLSGGASTTMVTRFGHTSNGKFDPMASAGGSLLQQFAIDPSLLEHVPSDANTIAHRQTTPLFGAGLLEAIPDAEILLNAARQKPDGITGRAAMITDVVSGATRVGRLGWKAQHSSLLGFAGDAYLNEMGVTNRFFPTENAPNGNMALIAKYINPNGLDDPTDPATGRSDIDASADFMRMLGPPPPLRLTASAVAGQRLFEQVKCSACHTPTLFSGASDIDALSHKTVPLYSDLLLHDMGSLGDGIEQGAAHASEMKTAPLWGLRARTQFLHDGRAKTVTDAVLAHAGEGAAAQSRFRQLTSAQVQQLVDFLNSI